MEIEELLKLRESIDSVDRRILELVVERARLAVEVGRLKQLHDLPIYDPQRERVMLEELVALAQPPLEPDAIRRVFEAIIVESRRLQQRESDGR